MDAIDAVKDLLMKTGTAWILWLLAALSVISIAIVVERVLFYRSRTGDLRVLAEALHRKLAAGDIDGAIQYLGRSRAVSASIAAAGLRLAHLGPAAAEKAMQSATAYERTRLDQRLAYLGTVGNNAPFVGLFGTVVGIIHAFEHLGAPAAGAVKPAAAAGQVASQAVMSSIAEALVATAIGILVALPAVASYNYLQRRVSGMLSSSEVLSNLVLAYLSGVPEGPRTPAPEAGPRVPLAVTAAEGR